MVAFCFRYMFVASWVTFTLQVGKSIFSQCVNDIGEEGMFSFAPAQQPLRLKYLDSYFLSPPKHIYSSLRLLTNILISMHGRVCLASRTKSFLKTCYDNKYNGGNRCSCLLNMI
jgi:hypothetical protein